VQKKYFLQNLWHICKVATVTVVRTRSDNRIIQDEGSKLCNDIVSCVH